MAVVFLHGVPDTPAMWDPLIAALGLGEESYLRPALPGFGTPVPGGFSVSKDAYVDWLIERLEHEAARSGPVDLVTHDWGGLIGLRAAHLRADLIRTFVVFDAALLPGFRWHRFARTWQRLVWGEISMALTTRKRMERALVHWGMPEDLASREAAEFGWTMKRSILNLYRSSVDVGREWGTDLSGLPARTHVFWGAGDPFGKSKYAKRFCEEWDLPLHIEPEVGHLALCERPAAFAGPLQEIWTAS